MVSKDQFLEKNGQNFELEIVELLWIKEFDPELAQNYDFLRKIQIIKRFPKNWNSQFLNFSENWIFGHKLRFLTVCHWVRVSPIA